MQLLTSYKGKTVTLGGLLHYLTRKSNAHALACGDKALKDPVCQQLRRECDEIQGLYIRRLEARTRREFLAFYYDEYQED